MIFFKIMIPKKFLTRARSSPALHSSHQDSSNSLPSCCAQCCSSSVIRTHFPWYLPSIQCFKKFVISSEILHLCTIRRFGTSSYLFNIPQGKKKYLASGYLSFKSQAYTSFNVTSSGLEEILNFLQIKNICRFT